MKTIVIVGATGGIGSAVGRLLSGLGYQLVGIDVADVDEKAMYDGFHLVDIRDTRDYIECLSGVARSVGSIWGLIYCAGVYPIVGFEAYELDLWDAVHDVNVRGAYIAVKALWNFIEEGGRIILVASGAAHVGSRDIGYSSSKAAMLGLMRGLVVAGARRGLLINAVCPGVIETSMSRLMSDESRAEYVRRIALQRFGSVDEVAVAMGFLLDERNSYMTGATLDIHGGLYAR